MAVGVAAAVAVVATKRKREKKNLNGVVGKEVNINATIENEIP